MMILGVSASFELVTHEMSVQGSVCVHGTALRGASLSSQVWELTVRTDICSLFSRLDRVFQLGFLRK